MKPPAEAIILGGGHARDPFGIDRYSYGEQLCTRRKQREK